MKITLLGTGCPQCHTERYGPANLLRHGEHTILIDCGSGVTQRLLGAGSSGARLDALLLTHLHSDHLVDLYQLIVSSWHQGRNRPQRIFGPPGTRDFVESTMALWQPERELRIQHEQRPSTAALEVEVVEFGEGVLLDTGDLRVSAVAVDHRPVKEAFGFVFEAPGEKAVFSGDTRYCQALIHAAQDCDLLVHECFIHREMHPAPGLRSREGIEAVASYHTLSGQVGRVAREAGARFLMLNHFVPASFDREALIAEVAREFEGAFVVGEDLMEYDIGMRVLGYGGMRGRIPAR